MDKKITGRTFYDLIADYPKITFLLIFLVLLIIFFGFLFGNLTLKIGGFEINKKTRENNYTRDTIYIRDTIFIEKSIYPRIISSNKNSKTILNPEINTKMSDNQLSKNSSNSIGFIRLIDGSKFDVNSIKCINLKEFDGIDYGTSIPYFRLSQLTYRSMPKIWNKLDIAVIKKIEFLKPPQVEIYKIDSLMAMRKYRVQKVNIETINNMDFHDVYILVLEYNNDVEKIGYTDQIDIKEIVIKK